MDNGSTSYPKAPHVGKEMCLYIENIGININRGSYSTANNTLMDIWDTREKLLKLFNSLGSCCIFTSGATASINLLLNGYIKKGDHIIISSFEHNAVLRPIHNLTKIGVEYSIIPAAKNGISNLKNFNYLVKPNTKLVLVNHVSNVSGIIFPLEELALICKKMDLPLAVDASQSAGHIHIDFNKLDLSALCIPGHKGLLGPQGIGALILRKDLAKKLAPINYGGTGSKSHDLEMPEFLPDKFEAGTLNLPGIYGLNTSIDFILNKGIDYFRQHEINITKIFLESLQDLPIRIIGETNIKNRVGLVSIDFLNFDNGIIAQQLEEEYGILTRSGLHCAPLAHKTLNTYPNGTVRFSFGYSTTIENIYTCVSAIKNILKV